MVKKDKKRQTVHFFLYLYWLKRANVLNNKQNEVTGYYIDFLIIYVIIYT